MKKTTFLSLAAVAGCFCMNALSANAQTFMEPATLDYPSGLYASFPPSSVSITYDNQPIKLIDPQTNDWGDEYVTAYVKLGEAEPIPVSASVLYSFGDPENPDDEDVWNLDIALYELDDLWAFDGKTVTVIVPEGIVCNYEGDLNPEQEFVFEMMPTYLDYTINPGSGSTLSEDYTVRIEFNHNPIEYLQSQISFRTYDPIYKDISLELGKEVSISENNELLIDLSGFASGEYELVIPEGFVTITEDGEKYLSPDLWLEYTIENDSSGINEIKNADSFTVYDLQGRLLLDGASRNAIGNLPAGIYIVNGKKLVKTASF